MRPLEILVVDDNPAIARFLIRSIRKLGHHAHAPCHRLDAVLARIAENAPDVVFMDLDMGGRSSLETMELLAASGHRVVCISGYSPHLRPTPEHIPRLSKPIDEAAIAELLASLPAPTARENERGQDPAQALETPVAVAPPAHDGTDGPRLPSGSRRLRLVGDRLQDEDGQPLGQGAADELVDALTKGLGISRQEATAALRSSGAHLVGTLEGAAVLLASPPASSADGGPETRAFTLMPLVASHRLADDIAALGRAARELGLGPGFVFWETDAQRRIVRIERDTRGAQLDLEALLTGHRLEEVFTPRGARGETENPLAAALAGQQRFQDVRVFLPAAGTAGVESVWRFTGLPLLDDDGGFRGFRGVAQDDGFQRFIDGIPLSILIWSADHRILASNRTLHEVLGMPREAILGLDFDAFVNRLDLSPEDPSRQLDPRTMDGLRFWVRGADDALHCQSTRVTPLETRSGTVYMAIYSDITNPIETERTAHADDLARLSASAAHDIGNAVTILDGVVARLVDSDRSTREELAEDMHDTLGTMRALLDRMQRLASASLGTADAGENEADLQAVIERVGRLFRRRHPDLRLEIQVTEDDAGKRIAAPPIDVERALTNLLTNAVDASGARGRIRLRQEDHFRDGRPHCRLTVEDDGPGFAPYMERRALDAFVTSKEGEGSGLGLFQVSTFARRHRGEIRLGRSRALGGARVDLSLPWTDAS